jgi:hypothetical protein
VNKQNIGSTGKPNMGSVILYTVCLQKILHVKTNAVGVFFYGEITKNSAIKVPVALGIDSKIEPVIMNVITVINIGIDTKIEAVLQVLFFGAQQSIGHYALSHCGKIPRQYCQYAPKQSHSYTYRQQISV